MNRAERRFMEHRARKPCDLNRKSTHKIRSEIYMGSKIETRRAIEEKLAKEVSNATAHS